MSDKRNNEFLLDTMCELIISNKQAELEFLIGVDFGDSALKVATMQRIQEEINHLSKNGLTETMLRTGQIFK